MESHGTITLGVGTSQQRTINITDVVRCTFKDHRLATIAKDEEGNYVLSIENPKSSGRHIESTMYLSEGSFMSLMFVAHIFMGEKNIDLSKKLEEYNINENEINFEYHFSDENKLSDENH